MTDSMKENGSMKEKTRDKAAGLAIWSGPVEPVPLGGGLSNQNFVVEDGGEKFVVRISDDLPEHGVLRFNEVIASRAAHAAGLSPEVVHDEPGVLVLRYIDSRTLGEEDVCDSAMLDRIVPLLKRVHKQMPDHIGGAVSAFWVFQAMRNYRSLLKRGESRMMPELPRYEALADELEEAVGPVRLVYCHNDLLPANFLDDGERLWLLDWEYGGLNSPLFDLANLASNSRFDPVLEDRLLHAYFEGPVTHELRRSYEAMKCASLLREAMWSMVSEIHSRLDLDYVAYTTENLERFEQAYRAFS